MGSKTELIDVIRNLSEEKAKKILDKIKKESEKDSNDIEDEANVNEEDPKDDYEHPFMKLCGIWKDRNITLEDIREKAWKRK